MLRLERLALSATFVVLATAACAQDAKFSDNVIRIGVLNDRSGPYADLSGEGSAIGARMAAEEFGNKINGIPIEIVVADHQNKTDVGAGIARKWYDADGVDLITDVSNSAMSLALNGLVKDRKKLVFHNSGSADISGKGCAARAVQWMYSVNATAANVATKENVDAGMNTFYIISVDYALGASISKVFRAAMANTGAKILGEVSHPLNSTDFSSYLLQAQSSGAKAVLLATGGQDLGNAVKQAAEFGLTPKVQLLAAAMTTTEIEASGLAVMQGLQTVSFYEWNRDEKAKAWGQKYSARAGGKIPAGSQAATYSQVRHYLKAIEATGTDDADVVLAKMKELTVDDAFTSNGKIREDGLLLHDMYLVRLKAPSESTGKGDYTRIIQVIPGERANIPLAQSECPLVKK